MRERETGRERETYRGGRHRYEERWVEGGGGLLKTDSHISPNNLHRVYE